jgi:hypothetical protein
VQRHFARPPQPTLERLNMMTICETTPPKATPAVLYPSTILYWRPMTDENGFLVQCDEEFESELCDPEGNFPSL